MATDLRADQRMSDDEVMAQITTFVSLAIYVKNGGRVTDSRCWPETRPLQQP
jgi:hypothetical protein